MIGYDKEYLHVEMAEPKNNISAYDPRERLISKFYNSYLAMYIQKLCKPIFNIEKYLTHKRARDWSEGGIGETRDPTPFLYNDDTTKLLISEIITRANKEDRMLDLACSCGRVMNDLYEKGYISNIDNDFWSVISIIW